MTTRTRAMRAAIIATALTIGTLAPRAQQPPAGTILEESAAPGANYDKADFRLWYPNDVASFVGVVVLVPGSNGDGRGEVADAAWQAFAIKNKLALLGCSIKDKPHDQNFIEEYVNVSKGSGQALLDTLAKFGDRAKHPELAKAPLFLWGMSAGGQFNYEFVAWKPERVLAFVVNKGGIYYSALLSHEARNVPGFLFTGGKDLESRRTTIAGLFQLNRRGAALWAFAEEPAAAHIVGRSKEIAMMFYEDLLPLRLGTPLKTLSEKDGFRGDLHEKTYQPAGTAPIPATPTAWLPTERVAKAWKAMVTETPFEK